MVDRGYKDWWRGQLRGRTGEWYFLYLSWALLFCCWLSCIYLSLSSIIRHSYFILHHHTNLPSPSFTGIFPVNYVELLPPPDESQLAAEAIEEAKVFAEVGNVERLLEGLREVEKEWGVYARDQVRIFLSF